MIHSSIPRKSNLIKKWELSEFPFWEFALLLVLVLSEGGLSRQEEVLVSGAGWKSASLIWNDWNDNTAEEQEDTGRCRWGGMQAGAAIPWPEEGANVTGAQGARGGAAHYRSRREIPNAVWTEILNTSLPRHQTFIKSWNSSDVCAGGFFLGLLHGYDWHAVKT